MKLIGLILSLFWLVGCTDADSLTPNTSQTTLAPLGRKVPLFPAQNWGHQRVIWVPTSYWAPIKDTLDVQIRLLVPMIWDPIFGMTQPTTFNIYQADSIVLDGQTLTLFSGFGSQMLHFPPEQGQSLQQPYTDSTIVMLLYDDSSMQIIPNSRYSNELVLVPQRGILGFYFVLTDYYQQ